MDALFVAVGSRYYNKMHFVLSRWSLSCVRPNFPLEMIKKKIECDGSDSKNKGFMLLDVICDPLRDDLHHDPHRRKVSNLL